MLSMASSGVPLTFSRRLRISRGVTSEGAQALNLLLQGLAVGAVHKWDLLLAERLCHSLVCRDHEVLDHLRCIVALVDADVQGLSVLIQNDLRLLEIEVDGTALRALCLEHLRKLQAPAQHPAQLQGAGLCGLISLHLQGMDDLAVILIRKELHHTGIGQLGITPDDGLHHAGIQKVCLLIKVHDAGECIAVLSLIQRADAVGELLSRGEPSFTYCATSAM